MDLNVILQTIVEYDEKKPWSILFCQLAFSSFRNYSLEYIEDILDDDTSSSWDTLEDLCNEYCDPAFKPYIVDFFRPEHYEQYDEYELYEEFFRAFLKSLDLLIKDPKYEETVVNFFDYNMFVFFEILLDETDYYIFPKLAEEELNIEKYLEIRQRLLEEEDMGLEQVPIEEIQEQDVFDKSRSKTKWNTLRNRLYRFRTLKKFKNQ